MTSDTVLTTPSCTNCDAALSGQYCAQCGQKVLLGPPTMKDFAHEAAEELFNVDGKIFRTLRLLFTRPGALTREQFQGRRARYVRPLRLYLIFSLLAYTAMALTREGEPLVGATESDEARGAILRAGVIAVAYAAWLVVAILLVAAVFLGWWAMRLG